MRWSTLPFFRPQRDAASLNNIYNCDMTITCHDIVFYGRQAVMNRYTQYFSNNLAELKYHITSNFNKSWNEQDRTRAEDEGDTEDEEEKHAREILQTTEKKGANFDLSVFRPFIVYSVLVWCHKQEYPPKEVEERFVDRKEDLTPLINHIRTHHLARHLSIQPLADLTLSHIRRTLSRPLPLGDFLNAIPIIYKPPTDLSIRRLDPVKNALIQRTVIDVEELSEERQWVALMQSNATYSSDVALEMVEEKRYGRARRRIGYQHSHGGRDRSGGIWWVLWALVRMAMWALLVVAVARWIVPAAPKNARLLARWKKVWEKMQKPLMRRVVVAQRQAVKLMKRFRQRRFVRHVGSRVAMVVEWVKKVTRKQMKNIPGDFEKVYGDLKSGIGIIGDRVKDTFVAVGNVAGDHVTDTVAVMGSAASALTEDAKTILESVPGKAVEWGGEVAGKTLKEMESGFVEGYKWGEKHMTDAKWIQEADGWTDEYEDDGSDSDGDPWNLYDEFDGYVFNGKQWTPKGNVFNKDGGE